MNPNVVERVLKMKTAGVDDSVIAVRMELTTEEVRLIVATALQEIESNKANGYIELAKAFSTLCFQYQLIGESLKVIGGALSASASLEEIKSVLAGQSEPEAALLSNFIVLRKFTPPIVQEPKKN